MPKSNNNQLAVDIAVIKEQLGHISEVFKANGKFDEYCQCTTQNSNSITWIKTIGGIALTIIVPIIGFLFINH